MSKPDAVAEKPERRRPWLALILSAVLFVWMMTCAWVVDYTTGQKLAPSGGIYFVKSVELPVPIFAQGDPRWRHDPLAYGRATIGSEGCAVSSAAMVMSYYGIKTDPQQLNWYLQQSGGFTRESWLYWEAPPQLAPGHVEKAYEDRASYARIDWNLLQHNPVIVRIRFLSGTTHFVVIAGKRGYDYLICDPGAGANRGLYPLRELGRPIEALRYYRVLQPIANAATP